MTKKSYANIVMAANAMIENYDMIEDVMAKDSSLYFMYNKKYIWRIYEDRDEYVLSVYPGYSSLNELFRDLDSHFTSIVNVSYSSHDFKSREASETFRELYQIVKEKKYDVHKILEDIVSNSKLWNKE